MNNLLNGFSLEATLPAPSEIAALRDLVAPGKCVYLSAPPKLSPLQLATLARQVRAAGLEPVPHVVARTYRSREDLDAALSRLAGEAGVSRVLVLAGDRADPAGPFADALAVMESDLLQKHGIDHVGVSGYPDGHPKIADGMLATALARKLAAARLRGLAVHLVTQFCFDPERIVAWLRWLRRAEAKLPVRLGIAGPTSVKTLVRYALRCGVRATISGMLNPGARQIVTGSATSDGLIQSLMRQLLASELSGVNLHFFTFGGLVSAARWARENASNAALAH